MAGGQTHRYLIVGDSGSGKTVYVSHLLDAHEREKPSDFIVVISTDSPEDSELSKRCNKVVELDNELAALEIDWVRYLKKHTSVYIEVTALDPHAAIGRVAAALLTLGNALGVFDEINETVTRKADPRTLTLWTRGRKRGVHLVASATSMKQRDQTGINPVVITRSNVLVTFLVFEEHEFNQITKEFPRIKPHLRNLKTPHDGGLPEYAWRHKPTGRERLVLRSGEYDLRAGGLSP